MMAGCAVDLPDPPQGDGGFRLQDLGQSFAQPIFVGHAGDGSGRLFVAEQRGTVQVRDDGRWSQFLDLTSKVLAGGERGLLGLAFHPDHKENGRLFVHYTDRQGDTVVSELRHGSGVAQPSSERVLLRVDQPYSNHNGGMIAFGADGMLYIALGDGGSAGDPQDRAQDLDSLLGKLLRIDVDGTCADAAGRPLPYCIPDDNPFADRTRGKEVWAYGLRNPWRFSFDRGSPQGDGRGDLWIADVGQQRYEEVNVERAASNGGVNYGWSRYEGRHVHDADRRAPGAVDPVAEYDHAGRHCSITGGYVYRGSAVAGLQGTYLLADYCSGVVWTMRADGRDGYALTEVLDTQHRISSFGEDESGELYVVDHGGRVLKVVAAADA
jgi:glucose/arabinose dehydrogenase